MTATTTIQPGTSIATLINVFTVQPQRQRELVDALVSATDEVMQQRPGFISASVHASSDGQRVVNYAQWDSEDAFRAMLADPAARERMQSIAQLAEAADPRLYAVVSAHHA